MHVDVIHPRTRELLDRTLLKLTKKKLGSGSGGIVFEGVLAGSEVTDEVRRVAVKEIALAGDDDNDLVEAPRREIDALIAAADIDSIAPLLCWSLDRATKTLSIVTELFEGGTLGKLLHRPDKQKQLLERGEPLMLRFAYQVARGVHLLHSRLGGQVCHFDLKPDNVVLSSRDFDEAEATIIDLGSARIFTPDKQHTLKALGSEEYMAPECHFSEPAGTAADVWSLGVMLWEMFQVWPDQVNRARPRPRPLTLENIQQRTFPNDLGTVPNGVIRALVARCTAFDQAARTNGADVVATLHGLGAAHEQLERCIRTLVGYIGNRIAQSETLYHVGRKTRALDEWRRITSTHKHAKDDLLQYFSEKQIRMLAQAVDSNEYIRCAAFNRLESFAGDGLDHKLTHGVYLWRNANSGAGYVGKIERHGGSTRQQRDAEHRRGATKFDLALQSEPDAWSCVSVCSTVGEMSSAVVTRLECLLVLLLDTHSHRNGFNDELGGVWGATKRYEMD